MSSVWMASAHLLSLMKLPICLATITVSNSFMMVTLMFDPCPVSNLSLAINSVTTSHTSSLTRLTHSALTLQFPASHLLASLAISMSVAFIFGLRTASSLTHVSMPPRRLLHKHFSMVPLAFGSPLIKIGLMPTLLIRSCRRSSRLFKTLDLFPTKHLRDPSSTPTIVRLCATPSSLSKIGILIYRETIVGSESYTRLQLIPSRFRNIIFVAFHANPIGAHLNPYCTFHHVRLCFYWPGMYAYITKMC